MTYTVYIIAYSAVHYRMQQCERIIKLDSYLPKLSQKTVRVFYIDSQCILGVVLLSKTQTPLDGHRLRTCCTTPPTDTTNGRAHSNSTTNLPHRNARAQHLDMSRCWDVANFCPLVVFVGGVRSRCPCSGVWA